MVDWNNKVKCILKSELAYRNISHSDLVVLLNNIGLKETKSSIDSKISRGKFSATFLIQCLTVIGCKDINIDSLQNQLNIAAEPKITYKLKIQNHEAKN